VAAGLAATGTGLTFNVSGTGDIYASTYPNVGGVAVFVQSYPSAKALADDKARLDSLVGRATDQDQIAAALQYADGRIGPLQRTDGRGLQTLASGAVEVVPSQAEVVQAATTVVAPVADRLDAAVGSAPATARISASVQYSDGRIGPLQRDDGGGLQTLADGSD
jgi:hypothetical protein